MNTIKELIHIKCVELNITYKELIIKTGYSNVSVGLKRLNQLFNNDYQASSGLIKKLPEALKLSDEVINQAVICSKLEQQAEQEEVERLWFRPNFLIRTANSGRPKQIFIASILNAGQYIHDDYPADLSVTYYKRYAIAFFHEHCAEIMNLYDEPIDIVINYTYEQAEVISLVGEHIAYLNKHVKAGKISYEI